MSLQSLVSPLPHDKGADLRPFATRADFEAALAAPCAPDAEAREAARARQAELTKPLGSLGQLEDMAVFFAGWQSHARPALTRARAVVFAGNHGFAVHGVSAYPTSVTAQMVANFRAGGAGVNALSGAAGMELAVVELDLDTPTHDFTTAPAMSEAECLAALNAGAASVDPDLDLFAPGEMGIGNTTAAAAISAHVFGGTGADWIGPGTGLDNDGMARKLAVIDRALAFHADAPRTAFETLRRLGGREIAAMAGAILQARRLRIPIMLDGFICCSALAALTQDGAGITDHCLAGHCSAEPGHMRLLGHLGLEPLLRLSLRLGEASGACVAVPLVRSALAAHNEMATFAQAGVSAGQ
ncbi:Nicotinate-nucleotide-dimethylbenzimidazole phosphoribosyltransferase [Novosphingobium nitrogenifigens DSM 19370]|uniref:Nicotinate-nucleotide--dimethylbenzimidazole phosphoribosyltransferase n=1 Tax=Novosphingobium nitrogenifigens DSM 19370 TaxID=983920 RepID=F1Z392_9SPHN|nr:nicotinate-nucleotide--dimethylbenzimidazole phosphoribosyltransferase [Novosphingobium nitrogenifigens]EGD60921.1 Nicotinate-nucleotide-dimethylbenzimidazole phosphoribosyltransferase [Novosphingobium nitrogenifigens DSM 19370]